MTDVERWRRVEQVLDAVLTSNPSEREAAIAAQCGEDAALRDEIEDLLRRSDRAAPFDRPPAGVAAALLATESDATGASNAGRRVGPFKLLHEIGRGGMSRVFLAERADGAFSQRVAVKLLRSNLDSESDQHRFRAERQILATLNHPHIARLIDGGMTDDGLPYLVLEYVEGKPIDAWCDERALDLSQRLALFTTVAKTTQYAHNNLVVHRDLKPSNIFVGADGDVKLLDFGLAKLLDPSAASAELATRAGHRWMTLEYAAPEQVTGQAITTLTDVYQLAAVLYQLVSGQLPFGVQQRATPRSFEDAILHADPPDPSSLAAAGAPILELRRAAQRELDAIVLKGLSKDPARRYASATALVDDLQRFLEGRPVHAAADSAGYRVRKFVRRHRRGVGVAAALLLMLGAAGFRERTLRERAEAESRKARAVEQYLVNVFDMADPFAPPDPKLGETTARAILDRGASRIDSVLADEPDVQAELRRVIGRVYGSLGIFDRAAPILQRALDQQRALHGSTSVEVAATEDQLGEVLTRLEQFDKAEPLLRDALAQRRTLLGTRDTAVAASLDHLGDLLRQRNDFTRAQPALREALDIRRAVLGDSDIAVAKSTNQLGLLYWWTGKYDEAEPLYRSALAVMQRRLGEDHPSTASVIHNLAQLKQMQGGQVDEAIALYRRALAAKRKSLGNRHPSVTINLNNLGGLLAREKGGAALDEAEALVREALATDREIFGDRHGYVAASLNNLGSILRAKGDFVQAEAYYRQSLDINQALFGREHLDVALALNNLGTVRQLQGDPSSAVPLFREALGIYGRAVGEKHNNYATVSVNLAKALRESGKTAEAERIFLALEGRVDSAKQRQQYLGTEIGLGRILTDRGDTAAARPKLERALAIARKHYGEGHWRTAEAKLVLGICLRADSLLRQSYAVLSADRSQLLLAREARLALEKKR